MNVGKLSKKEVKDLLTKIEERRKFVGLL